MKKIIKLKKYPVIVTLLFIIPLLGILLIPVTQATLPSTVTKYPTLEGDKTQEDIPLTSAGDHIYHITGNLTISSNISGNQTGVIFVDGNLNIGPIPSNKLQYGTANSGLVFVIKGDVNIDKDVTQVDAVIIAQGKIYTAGATCSQLQPVTASQLVINGSLVSLNEANEIEFCRKLGETGALKDSTDPAEIINHQVKYLVILRDLMSDTYQKWSEIP